MKKEIVIIASILLLLVSCAIKSRLTPTAAAGTSVTPSPIYFKVDTVNKQPQVGPVRPRRYTQKEAQEYLRQQYKMNYDELVAPDIKRLYGVIEDLVRTNHMQVLYMQVTRHRTDSIARERNFYRSQSIKKDSVNHVRDSTFQSTIYKLSQDLLSKERIHQQANKKQINFNTWVSISCLIAFICLLGTYIRLRIQVARLSTKLDKIILNA